MLVNGQPYFEEISLPPPAGFNMEEWTREIRNSPALGQLTEASEK